MTEKLAPRAVPEVTVSMPAYNAGRYIRQALESVLSQEEIELEIVVVDDASTDDTASIVEGIVDPRLRLVRQAANRGTAACHNVVLGLAAAPVVAHVDADDVLLPGALRKLVDAVTADPRVAQAHCHFLDIDAHGRLHRRRLRERLSAFEAKRRPPIDYRRRLPTSAGIINHLRTYRADVLRELGGFDERLRHGVDYDMALRILERYEIALVPEYLYCWRNHSGSTTARMSPLRHWRIRYEIRRRAIREGKVTYWDRPELHLRPVLRELARARRGAITAPLRRAVRRLLPVLRWLVFRPIETFGYRTALAATRLLPFDRLFESTPAADPPRGALAYFFGGFPILSETFIQREVEALEAAGVPVVLLALEARGRRDFDDRAARLMRRTYYLEAPDAARRRAARRLLLRHPLRYLACRAFVTSRVHADRKTARRDAEVFRSAVRLAVELRRRRIAHLHSPWANRHAFVAIVAAALAKIPYSVQARAYDVHREGHLALEDKLAHAAFVITNTRYNAEILQGRLPRHRRPPLHVIHNGVDLAEFPAAPPPFHEPGECRLLLVGRLVEQKGIEYLLQACSILAAQGRRFSCAVVGGRTPTEINHGVQLRKLARSLGLDEVVTFVGSRAADQVLEFYAAADVVVLPAVICESGARDVTPNVLLEAMAMRRPVVSTAITGIPELVEHEVTGLLVPPRDAEALAAAIARIMDAPDLGRRYGENGRARVETLFDIRKNIAAYRALFTPRVGTAEPPRPDRASAASRVA